jgi:carboxypeptidase C (cathepsin A)
MKKLLVLALVFNLGIHDAQDLHVPVDTMVVSSHKTIIKGVSMTYTAETGMQPVWNSDGSVVASLFYTYYTRDNVKSRASRPLIMVAQALHRFGCIWPTQALEF